MAAGAILERAPAWAEAAGAGGTAAATRIGLLPFVGEGSEWREALGFVNDKSPTLRRYGKGLGGRQVLDLETLVPARPIVASDQFFVRTFEPDVLPEASSWTLAVDGLVAQPRSYQIAELRRRARPRGAHLIECSGNAREHDFGLMSSAAWDGVPALDLLEAARPKRGAVAVEISGEDEHRLPSLGSTPGASWVFKPDQLERAGAFFATAMNGQPLRRDHGFPLRLVVPGWYGCVSIKWATTARWVGAEAPATPQMKEFAERTMQHGTPERALDYLPASIDPAAMPIRAELWEAGGRREVRLTGILWGGAHRVRHLEIQCGDNAPNAPWARVDHLEPDRPGTAWRFWTHSFAPAGGRLPIRLRVADRGIATRRLDASYYRRMIAVPEA